VLFPTAHSPSHLVVYAIPSVLRFLHNCCTKLKSECGRWFHELCRHFRRYWVEPNFRSQLPRTLAPKVGRAGLGTGRVRGLQVWGFTRYILVQSMGEYSCGRAYNIQGLNGVRLIHPVLQCESSPGALTTLYFNQLFPKPSNVSPCVPRRPL
jgi:hypothetical protein